MLLLIADDFSAYFAMLMIAAAVPFSLLRFIFSRHFDFVSRFISLLRCFLMLLLP